MNTPNNQNLRVTKLLRGISLSLLFNVKLCPYLLADTTWFLSVANGTSPVNLLVFSFTLLNFSVFSSFFRCLSFSSVRFNEVCSEFKDICVNDRLGVSFSLLRS